MPRTGDKSFDRMSQMDSHSAMSDSATVVELSNFRVKVTVKEEKSKGSNSDSDSDSNSDSDSDANSDDESTKLINGKKQTRKELAKLHADKTCPREELKGKQKGKNHNSNHLFSLYLFFLFIYIYIYIYTYVSINKMFFFSNSVCLFYFPCMYNI